MKMLSVHIHAVRLMALASLLCFMGCKPDPLEVPLTYDGTNFEVNTADYSEAKTNLVALTDLMKQGRTQGKVVSYVKLDSAFSAGSSFPLASITTTYYKDRIAGNEGWLSQLAAASGGTFDPALAPAGTGGVYGGYLFDKNGLELEQVIEKGLYAAALYNLGEAAFYSPGYADHLLLLYGGHPDFANSDDATKHDHADVLVAKYAARRDKNDGNGYYTQIGYQFRKLQAALAASDDYQTELFDADAEIKRLWEEALAATIINYCYDAAAKLSSTNPSAADKAAALHSISECVGFVHGWYRANIGANYHKLTDADAIALLDLLHAPAEGTPAVYLFATDPFNEVPRLTQVIDKLTELYAFSATDLEDFKKNWVKEQGR
ncbi:MAG: hypothetical protein EAZ89_13650 [Bacteroidetes bacterium]|nr:MAG: hypothetical protein EAZ89_13650 [Bacteroidota bacterium]